MTKAVENQSFTSLIFKRASYMRIALSWEFTDSTIHAKKFFPFGYFLSEIILTMNERALEGQMPRVHDNEVQALYH